jgi:hypothetical protein
LPAATALKATSFCRTQRKVERIKKSCVFLLIPGSEIGTALQQSWDMRFIFVDKMKTRGKRIFAVTSQLLLLAVCVTQACCSDQWVTFYLFTISRCHEEEERMLVLTSSRHSDWQMAPAEINF